MTLITTPNFRSADDYYEALVEAHRGLPLARSHELNVRLVLLLANHIGERAALHEALAAARASVLRDTEPKEPR
jgi:hypothetical protein